MDEKDCNDESCVCHNYKPSNPLDYNHFYVVTSYNLYKISMTDYLKISSRDRSQSLNITTLDGKELIINDATKYSLLMSKNEASLEDIQDIIN